MPFADGISSIENGTLLFSLAAAITYLYLLRQPDSLKRAIVKTLAVGLLCVLAIYKGGPWLLSAALGFGAAGDFFLAFAGDLPFLAGLASFLIAHIAYVALFLITGADQHLFAAEPWRLAVLAVLLAHSARMGLRLWREAPGELRIPILFYIAAILAMGAAALAYMPPVVIIGALLFIISDTILATERFLLAEDSRQRVWTSPAVWITYYAAQATIALAYLL